MDLNYHYINLQFIALPIMLNGRFQFFLYLVIFKYRLRMTTQRNLHIKMGHRSKY